MNTYVVNLAVPAGVGVGAGSVTSAMGRTKSITVTGTFTNGALLLEASNDGGVTWGQVPNSTFTVAGCRQVDIAAQQMRVRVLAAGLTGVSVDLGSTSEGGLFGTVPAPAANAAGATLDVSTYGSFMTFIVTGSFTGTLTIESSEDGVDFVPCLTFTAAGVKSAARISNLIRARSQGAIGAITPVITVGAINDDDALIDAAIAQPRTSFVFRPGGVATENVYTTWPTLMTALGLVQGTKTILFDDSVSSPCTIPAGGPYGMEDTEWLALNGGPAVAITVSAGVSFTGLRRFRGNMDIACAAAGPVSDFVDGDQVFLSEGVNISSNAATPMFDGAAAPAASVVTFFMDNATLGAGGFGNPVIDWTVVGTTLSLSLGSGVTVNANTLGVAAGVTLTPIYRSTSPTISGTQVNVAGTVTPSNLTHPRYIPRSANMATGSAIGEIVRCDPSGAGFTVTLPLITVFNANQHLVVKNVTNSANVITIDGNGAQTVDGAANTTIAAGFGSVTLVSDGVSNWDII